MKKRRVTFTKRMITYSLAGVAAIVLMSMTFFVANTFLKGQLNSLIVTNLDEQAWYEADIQFVPLSYPKPVSYDMPEPTPTDTPSPPPAYTPRPPTEPPVISEPLQKGPGNPGPQPVKESVFTPNPGSTMTLSAPRPDPIPISTFVPLINVRDATPGTEITPPPVYIPDNKDGKGGSDGWKGIPGAIFVRTPPPEGEVVVATENPYEGQLFSYEFMNTTDDTVKLLGTNGIIRFNLVSYQKNSAGIETVSRLTEYGSLPISVPKNGRVRVTFDSADIPSLQKGDWNEDVKVTPLTAVGNVITKIELLSGNIYELTSETTQTLRYSEDVKYSAVYYDDKGELKDYRYNTKGYILINAGGRTVLKVNPDPENNPDAEKITLMYAQDINLNVAVKDENGKPFEEPIRVETLSEGKSYELIFYGNGTKISDAIKRADTNVNSTYDAIYFTNGDDKKDIAVKSKTPGTNLYGIVQSSYQRKAKGNVKVYAESFTWIDVNGPMKLYYPASWDGTVFSCKPLPNNIKALKKKELTANEEHVLVALTETGMWIEHDEGAQPAYYDAKRYRYQSGTGTILMEPIADYNLSSKIFIQGMLTKTTLRSNPKNPFTVIIPHKTMTLYYPSVWEGDATGWWQYYPPILDVKPNGWWDENLAWKEGEGKGKYFVIDPPNFGPYEEIKNKSPDVAGG